MSLLQSVARYGLGVFLVAAGLSHLTLLRAEFLAQVPVWLPARDAVVIGSGLVELALGLALLFAPRQRVVLGWATAGLFVLVFPGNVSQFLTQTDAFGLNSDLARGVRLLFQPVLIVWALWSTAAWRDRALVVSRLRRR